MGARRLLWVVPATAAVAAAVLLAQWVLPQRAGNLPMRVPVEVKAQDSSAAAIDLRGFFCRGDGVPAAPEGAWPGFRGPRGDNIATDPVKIGRTWPPVGPARIWQTEVGEGYAGAAVNDGRLYLLDYDATAGADVLRCLSTADGRETWRRGYPIEIGRNHGISRTVCAVADGSIVSIGPKCHVLCADAVTGDFKWGIDLVREYGATVPPWYTGQNPLIEKGRVILAPGGKSLLMAVELSTGKVLWQTPNPRGWQMTHSSVVPIDFQGRRLYLYCTSGGAIGAWGDDGSIAFELPPERRGAGHLQNDRLLRRPLASRARRGSGG